MGDLVEEWKRHQKEVEDGYDRLPQELRKQWRWVFREGLFHALKRQFVAGDVSAALNCVHLCVLDGIPPQAWPKWARNYFVDACLQGYEGKLKSWDQVFGRPYTQAQYRRHIRDRHFPLAIYDRIEAARAAGRPIDDDLFEEVGRELGVGAKTLTKNLYAVARDGVAGVENAFAQKNEKGDRIYEERMTLVYRTVMALSAKGQPLNDKIFGELADLLHIDEDDVAFMYRHALNVHWESIGPTPQKPAE